MKELLAPDDTRDALRTYGGLLLGLAALMIFIRKANDPDPWGDFAIFLVLAVPAAYLYGEGVLSDRFTGAVRPWQAVYTVFGLIFVPLALFQFVEVVDGDTGASLNVFWIFAVTAALGVYAGVVKGIRFGLLFAAIATIIAWSALWNKLLGDEGIAGHFGSYRGLLGILSILLLVGALYLWRTSDDTRVTGTGTDDGGDAGLWKASELITGAGISAVLACSLGISSIFSETGALGFFQVTIVETSQTWDILLLVISLGLVGIGAAIGTRGPVYIGSIGLFLWLLIVGLDLNDESPEQGKFGIWPIVLLVLGGLFVALSSVKEASLGDQPKQTVDKLRGK